MESTSGDGEGTPFSIGRVWLDRDHGIVRVALVPGARHTLESAREQMAAIARLCEGKRRPLLIDMANMKSLNREARRFFSSAEVPAVCVAVALISRSAVDSMIINVFFAGAGGDNVPTRLFTSEAEAITWLKTFV